MRIPTRTFAAACSLAAALLVVAGCGGGGGDAPPNGSTGGEVLLQPLADQGPDPFTAPTDTTPASRPPITRTPQPSATVTEGVRSVSGATPGLYGGTRNTGSCDVGKQIRYLASDPARTRAFAELSGISPESVPDYLRRLTPVVLRADTGVTDHGFAAGRATGYQAVLQAGTAVLVDDRGVPRVRCACGNPLGRPTARDGNPDTRGRPWNGYRPAQVVVVTPAPDVITDITIVDTGDDTWIERPVGYQGHRHDHAVPPPDGPTPGPHDSAPGHEPSTEAPGGGRSPSPDASASDCPTPTATVTPAPTSTPGTGEGTPDESAGPGTVPTGAPTDGAVMDVAGPVRSARPSAEPSHCPRATVTAAPTTEPGTTPDPSGTTAPRPDPSAPDRPDSPEPSASRTPSDEPGAPTEDTAPDGPDVPDDGLIPDGPAGPDSVFDVSADAPGG
ncbi:hypothetical protein CW362_02570 [Streptomyces populi]|uniref:DUF6777 domain-containing protein n=1 Tax=Streptomyces populi TaxID=2058924 RepID=A0A2I0SXG3_9ACTN|nr:DUF6777 domain-containing protein [Streptomyces populi]PKT74624.1 hypothetical protein CW362_02570 [Streptomyces populi]